MSQALKIVDSHLYTSMTGEALVSDKLSECAKPQSLEVTSGFPQSARNLHKKPPTNGESCHFFWSFNHASNYVSITFLSIDYTSYLTSKGVQAAWKLTMTLTQNKWGSVSTFIAQIIYISYHIGLIHHGKTLSLDAQLHCISPLISWLTDDTAWWLTHCLLLST